MSCLVSQMSNQVKDAIQAMEIARNAAVKAGLAYNFVISARREGNFWFVQINALLGKFVVKIDISTGEVVEFNPA